MPMPSEEPTFALSAALQSGGRSGRRLTWCGSLLFTVLMVMPILTSAHPKTDVITLYNGDRLTGEIQSLLGGRLAVGTDAMGTLRIEWQEVASIESAYNYEVRLASGERLFGTVRPGALPGNVQIRDVFGEQDLNWSEIVELRALEEDTLDRLDIYVSANYAFTKASGVTQTELRANVAYEDRRAQNSLTTRLTVADTDEESSTSSRVSLSRRVWSDRQGVFRALFGGHESNDELGLDYRLTFGGGLGRFLLDTNNQTFAGVAGLQILNERSVEGDVQESLEAVIYAQFARWRFDSPQLDLKLDATIFPSLTESGRLRADTNATLRWELYNDLFWDLSTWGSYDNRSVDEAAGEFDWGITTGVGWDF